MLVKEIKDQNRKVQYDYQIENSTLVKMSMFPKLIYSFNAFSIKISVKIFVDIDELIIENNMEAKAT